MDQYTEDRFRNTMMQAPVGVTVLRGYDLIVEMANEKYLQFVDRQERDFVGKPLFEALPEVKEVVEPLLHGVLKTGEPFLASELEVLIRRFGNTDKCFFNLVYQPLREMDGSVTGIIVVATEVTSQVEAKHKIEQNEDVLRSVIESSPFAMVIFRGRDLIIEMPNEALLKNIWKRTRTEAEGKRLLDMFPELKDQQYPMLLNRVFDTGKSYKEDEAQVLIDTPDGMKKYYVDFEYTPLFDTQGVVSGIMASVNDVTERVESRNKINEAEQSLRLAIEAANMGTFDWNLDEQVFYSSPRLKEIFGFDGQSHATHQDLITMFHPDDLPIRNKAVEESRIKGSLGYEARVIWPDGSVHWIKIFGKIIYRGEKALRMYGTGLDTTEQRLFAEKLEQEVKQRTHELTDVNEALTKSNDELRQFAYVASHDLQEPLRKIQAFTSRIAELEGERLSPKGKDYFARVQASSVRMQKLIMDLLSYSKVNVSENKFESADLNEVLQRVTELFKEQIDQRHVVIRSVLLPVLHVVSFQFEQLFSNLVNNALKYSKQDVPPVITITAERLPAQALDHPLAKGSGFYNCIMFSDNGIGFDPQFNERIFQLFQRLHGRDEYEGTGIGLAICKKIVENHQGFIMAHGVPGEGAKFTICIPE